ncbi:hypothetical protein K474DRAFT_1658672 [Panus rudis PR-1116 ss-1]|nr:hypothetical protein K474DRAFT_1658672 [Panus rudis PR-1116 ss-1]
MKDPIQKFCSLVSSLGGPSIDEREITWVLDKPAGRLLVEWVAAQTPDVPSRGSTPNLNDVESNSTLDRNQPYTRKIALEAEEEYLLGIASHSHGILTNAHENAPLSYTVPSMLEKRHKAMESEVALLELETTRLKQRLKQAKLIDEQLKQTAKSLRASLLGLNTGSERNHESFSELTIKSDATISKAVISAQQLLTSKFDSQVKEGSTSSLDPLHSKFSGLSTQYARILSAAEAQFAHVQDARNALPTAADIKLDASALESTLRSAKVEEKAEALLDTAYAIELEGLCSSLDTDGDSCAMFNQAALDAENSRDTGYPNLSLPNVEEELENGWLADQEALLKASRKILDGTEVLFDIKVLPSLHGLYEELSGRSESDLEAEALISALLEELEEIADDVEKADIPSSQEEEAKSEKDLLNSLRSCFKEHRELRPAKAPPLVLLDESDVTDELEATHSRLRDAREAERNWLTSFPATLSVLTSSQEPLLRAMYANAPMNTSPPFAPPYDLVKLERAARKEAEGMSSAIFKLQKETVLGAKVQRRMAAFVEKWGT